MPKLTYIPKLSKNLIRIGITYDRELKGFKLDITNYKKGEEELIIKIFQQLAKVTSNPNFMFEWVTKTFKEQEKIYG